MRDLKNNIEAATVLASTDHTSTEKDSAEVDLLGFDAVAFTVEVGTITGAGSVTPAIEESDVSGSGFTLAAAGDVIGVGTALVSDVNQKLSYVGSKRFVRLSTTVVATITASTYGVLSVVALPHDAPVA